MDKFRLAVLKNESQNDHVLWVEACSARASLVEHEVVDITCFDWLERILAGKFHGLLAHPGGYHSLYKQLYDERVRVLHEELDLPVYPGMDELMIYENKRYLSYWLSANDIPHPSTRIFYHISEVLAFVANCGFPLVAKLNIGAGGHGVSFLEDRHAAESYIHSAFKGDGLKARILPQWKRPGFVRRAMNMLLHPAQLKAKIQLYQHARAERQKGFVIFQEFIPHTFEWRCVRIGNSFFAHKKMVKDGKASGSLVKGYDTPPESLLNFIRNLTDKAKTLSVAIDLFECADGQYLVNEVQCIFGQSDPHQMLINGKPGRYRLINGQWVFEEGDFNQLESFLLRLDHFVEILSARRSS